MNNEEIFNHCSIYENLDEFLKFNNIDEDEFDEKVMNGWYEDCTCGTYNGALNTFDPWEINPKNVADSLVNTFNNMDWDLNLIEMEGGEDDIKDDRDAILNHFTNYNIFILKDSKRIYLDLD